MSNGDSIRNQCENFRQTQLESRTLAYAKGRFEKLSATWKEFISNHAKISEAADIDGGHDYFSENYFEKTEEIYLAYSKELVKIIQSREDQGRGGASPKPILVDLIEESLIEQSTGNGRSFQENLDTNIGNGGVPLTEITDPRELAKQMASRMFQSKRSTLKPNLDGEQNVDVQNLFRAYSQQNLHNQSGSQSDASGNKYHNFQEELRFFSALLDRYNNRNATMDDRGAAQLQESLVRKWEIIEKMHQIFIVEHLDYDAREYRQLEADFEPTLYDFKSKIASTQNQSSNSSGSTPRMELSAKLPKLHVPKFNNDCTSYNSFKQLFMTMVGSRTSLTEVEKFAYLKSQLEGEAYRLILDLPIEDGSYNIAWGYLDARFNNQHKIATKLIAKIVEIKPMKSSTALDLKELVDALSQKVTGLVNLGMQLDLMSNAFLYFFTEKKVHPDIVRIYENSLTATVVPRKYEDFMNFLQIKVRNSSGDDQQKASQKDHQNSKHGNGFHKHNHQTGSRTALVASSAPSKQVKEIVCCKEKHFLYKCPKFLEMSPEARLKKCHELKRCINCFKSGHMAKSCSHRACTKCNNKHNTLLHFGSETQERTALLGSAIDNEDFNHVFLATALVEVMDQHGNPTILRALLDSGSQINMKINGVGTASIESRKRTVIQLKSKNSGFQTPLEVFVVKNTTTCQPAQEVDTMHWKIPKNIALADPKFNIPAAVDIIIGGELFYKLLSIGMISIGENLPDLQNTVFGWVVIGKLLGLEQPEAFVGIATQEALDQQLAQFWKIEEKYQPPSKFTQLEMDCEKYFEDTTLRDEVTGKFVVKLQFLKEPSVLGKSEEMAIRRFLYLEKRFNKDPDMKQDYVKFMKEYEDLGHMAEVNRKDLGNEFYVIPHHAVRNPGSSTTKFRVVFDASAKTTSNISLNEILANGPVLQDDLFSIMVRFRKHKYVFSADITKMYRQVAVDPNDQKWQVIVWREEPHLPLKFYKLKTVTYGTTCASYMAIKSLQHLADQHKELFPEGSIVAKRDFNVDDVMTGADDLWQATVIQEKLISLCHKGDFHLHKWCANHPALLETIPKSKQEVSLDINAEKTETKALGTKWIPKEDVLKLHYQPTVYKRITKRTVLSETAQLFDPLGLVNPVIVMAKIFLQELWALKLDWDAALPMELHTKWDNFRKELLKLNNISVPRHMIIDDPVDIQLHAFSDASIRAYGTTMYLRSMSSSGEIQVNLICSKSRVAPVAATTLPRLELCAGTIMTELAEKLKKVLEIDFSRVTYWTDSELVLSWIYKDGTYKTFVANRIASIKRKTKPQDWKYINTKLNPADLISRGVLPDKLINSDLWWHGPEFLRKTEEHWPVIKPAFVREPSEERAIKTVLTAFQQEEHFIERINHRNSFSTLQRVVAYIMRFKAQRQNKQDVKSLNDKALKIFLSTDELQRATVAIIKYCQEQCFAADLAFVKKGLGERTKFANFVPIIDADGVLRVGGRLQAANVPFEQKHPAILPKDHFVTRLLMERIHLNNMHAGPQALLAITRKKYWPESGKRLAQQIVRNCVLCVQSKPRLMEQIMGSLPAERVNQARPYISVGLDFGGPITIHHKLRGKRPTKAYICIFVCFTTKAVHIEAAADLSTESFINCLKRFIARRGLPSKIFCDNATNFVGANNQLSDLKEIMDDPEHQSRVIRYCQDHHIEWKFIPPRSPHFGGLYESSIKSSKLHLRKVLHSVEVTYDELITILAEIEAILNSRPLTPMSNDPTDLQPLTAGHFLIGSPMNSIDDRALPETSKTRMWTKIRKIRHEFWNRWNKEYLAQLQHRNKWLKDCDNVKVGTMVILKEINLPPLQWRMGRVTKTFSDNFGKIRVVNVKTHSGQGFNTIILKRAIHEIAPLPVNSDKIEENFDQEASSSQQMVKNERPKPAKLKKKLNPSAQSFEPRVTRSKTKKSVSFSAMTIMIFSFFAALILGASGQPCDVLSFKSNPGLYFEEETLVSLTSDDWKIVCYAQLENYWSQHITIKSLVEQLDEMCPQLSSSEYCDVTRKQIRTQLLAIQNKNELIKGFSHTRKRRAWSIRKLEKIYSNTLELSEAIEYEKIINKQKSIQGSEKTLLRQKRGWINPIGYGLKTITGVLDDNDGKRFEEKIENLNVETKHLLQLIGNQTTIQEITQNIIRRDETGMAKNLKKLENEIDALRNQDESKKAETFNALALQAVFLINSHTNIQNDILDMIIQTHHGKVSTSIISPMQLRQHMQIIASNISKELMIPGDDNTENIARVYAILTAKIRVTTSRIIFKITLPLLHREFFKLYHLIPIPFVYSNLTLNIIQTNYQYIGVNNKQDNYFLLSHQQRIDCKTYSEELLICEQNHPVFNTYGGEALCEMAIFSHQTKKIPAKCITKQILGKQLWSRINSPNKFLFTMVEPLAVNFICKENTSVCTIEGTGIINLPQECILQSGNIEIAAHNSHNSEIPVLFVPGINITDVLHENYKPRNISQHIQHPIYELDANLDVLSSALQTQRFNENFTPTATSISWHDVHHYTIIYIIVLLVALCIAFYAYKMKNNICRRATNLAEQMEMRTPAMVQPTPASRPRVSPHSAMASIETIDSVSFV